MVLAEQVAKEELAEMADLEVLVVMVVRAVLVAADCGTCSGSGTGCYRSLLRSHHNLPCRTL